VSTKTLSTIPKVIHYPDDDGLPMSDNSWQFNWIVLLHANLDAQFRDDPNVFVAGNHLIYAVEGDPKTRQAPDVYVAIGRPKTARGSYKVWEEAGIFPQVVFEVWSPRTRLQQMEDKRDFYEQYGAEEYYVVYPEFPAYAEGWLRQGDKLVRIPDMNGHVSQRLGIRFQVEEGELMVFHREGQPFRTPAEMVAEVEAQRARAAEEAARATEEKERADKLAARLRELGVDPDTV
jgi:Uma2 family endonuclease